eukprot:TRINITY_DN79637_c0_g1_i1.p1 TRINITY_DN79637_c0_g1~~TRINITY_DN79637_c0_g1_i1.p1  ORF type:complete len:906 (-),score=184.84 TRINITY_DN79637_c0_g1_i1:67-2784(-)
MTPSKDENSEASDRIVPRVEVPKSAVAHFVQPEVHIPLSSASRILGFSSEEELKKFATPLLKQFDGAEPLGPAVSAQSFNRLVILAAAKKEEARKLLEELSTSWRGPGHRARTVELPAEPISASGAIPRWPGSDPALVGMDREPLDRVRQYLQWRTRMRHFAGISCGIVRNGSLVFYQDAGFADAESKVKMTGDTLVRLFSMTKCLVAAAFMTYLEDPSRNIDLDDAVSKYIPAFAERKMSVLPKRGQGGVNQPVEKAITLRQLLTHTSGIGYGATLDDPWPPVKGSYYKIYEDLSEDTRSGKIQNLEQWCNALAKIPLKGQPGRYWDYSYSLDVLGRVLEVISGKSLDVVVEERVCGPLKMRDTKFHVPKDQAHRIGPWYKSVEIEGKPAAAHRLEIVDPGGEQSGWVGNNVSRVLSGGGTVEVPLAMKGGMVSTFNDYLRFLMMLRNFGELDGIRVLKKETVQMSICNHIPMACGGKRNVFVFDKSGLGYSCLGQIQAAHAKQDKGTYSGEYGWGGLAGPAWTIDPRSDLIILSMTQTAFVLDHEEYVRYAARRSIHQHIYGSVATPSKATSYAPENFDVTKAQSLDLRKPCESEEEEFAQEFVQAQKARVRTAKERAICPGPRLDRHPSEEERDGNAATSSSNVEATPGAAKRRRPSMGASDIAEMSPKGDASTPNARQLQASSPSGEGQLLFSRVAVREEDSTKKARVTAVNGDTVEIVTEGSWVSKKCNIAEISAIDESHLGVTTNVSGPKDFGFMIPKDKEKNVEENIGVSASSGSATKRRRDGADMSPKGDASTPNAKHEIQANSPAGEGQLLFSRVAIREEDSTKKARVTAVDGDKVEIVTEGSWVSKSVSLSQISAIDESRMGVTTNTSGPKDFGFMLSNNSNDKDKIGSSSSPKK